MLKGNRLGLLVALAMILGGTAAGVPAPAGTILKANCPCGYHLDNIMAGGGMGNFETFCAVPAYCAACKKLEILNYLDDAVKCDSCAGPVVFYNDPALQEKLPPGSVPKMVFTWNVGKKGTFKLPDVGYLCPKCGKLTLRFETTGFWD